MNKDIVFLLPKIQFGTGGFASSIDLMRGLLSLGYKVNIIIYGIDINFSKNRKIFLTYFNYDNLEIIYSPGYIEVIGTQSKWNHDRSQYTRKIMFMNKTFRVSTRQVIKIVFNKMYFKSNGIVKNRLRNTQTIFNFGQLSGFQLHRLRKLTKAKIIQNHAGSPQTFINYWLKEEHRTLFLDSSLSVYESFCMGYDYLLFQSEQQAKECVNYNSGLENKVKILLPSCNEKQIDEISKSQNPYGADEYAFVNVGTILPRKAQHLNIFAFHKLSQIYPNATLHLVGKLGSDKQYNDRIFTLIKDLSLETKVFIHGHRDDYLRFMCFSKAIVQSSLSEGVSRVLREAMYMKKPIIAFEISGTKDLLRNEIDAILVEPENIESLFKSMQRILDDRDLGRYISRNAYNKYIEKYSNNNFKNRIISLINEIK